MMSACEKAAIFYHDLLINHKSEDIKTANEYLTKRSISREIIDKFALGVAPKKYTALYDILKKDFCVIIKFIIVINLENKIDF